MRKMLSLLRTSVNKVLGVSRNSEGLESVSKQCAERLEGSSEHCSERHEEPSEQSTDRPVGESCWAGWTATPKEEAL